MATPVPKVASLTGSFTVGGTSGIAKYDDLPTDVEVLIIQQFDCEGHRFCDMYSRRGILYYATTCRRIRALILTESEKCVAVLAAHRQAKLLKEGWNLMNLMQLNSSLLDPFNKVYKMQFKFEIHNPYYMMATEVILRESAVRQSKPSKCNFLSPLECKRYNYNDDHGLRHHQLLIPEEDGILFAVKRKLTPFISSALPLRQLSWNCTTVKSGKPYSPSCIIDSAELGMHDDKMPIYIKLQHLSEIEHQRASCCDCRCTLHYFFDKKEYQLVLYTDNGTYTFSYKLNGDQLTPIGEDLLRIYYKTREDPFIKPTIDWPN